MYIYIKQHTFSKYIHPFNIKILAIGVKHWSWK